MWEEHRTPVSKECLRVQNKEEKNEIHKVRNLDISQSKVIDLVFFDSLYLQKNSVMHKHDSDGEMT